MRIKRIIAPSLLVLLALWALSACSVRYYVPAGITTQPHIQADQHFVASDGEKLSLRVWRAATGDTHQHMILLHGFNEYSGAFRRVGDYFAKQGVTVWAIDQRGFGRNTQRGLWAGHQRMAQDAQELAQVLKQQFPQQPLYLTGMSMGGAVSILAAAQGAQALPVEGLMLVAPAVWGRKTQPFYQRWALTIARTIAPAWSPTGKSVQRQATDNGSMLREIWRSPYMIRRTRIDTLEGLVTLMDAAYDAAPRLTIPTLLLYGAKDQIVPRQPIEDLWTRMPKSSSNVFKDYPEGWHMLMRDLQGEAVMADMVTWMKQSR